MMARGLEHRAGEPAVRDWPWTRLTAAAGIVYVVLAVAASIVGGDDPTPADSLDRVRAYFVDNRSAVLLGVYLDSLATPFFLAFAAGLGGLVTRRGGDTWGVLARLIAIGAIGTTTITLVENMAEAALAFHTAGHGEPGAVQALFDFYMMVPVLAFPLVAFLVAAAAGIVRSGVAPRWLGWVALVPVLSLLVGAAGLGNPRGPLAAVGFVGGFLPMLLWTLAVSIALLVRSRVEAPATGERPVQAGAQRWPAGS